MKKYLLYIPVALTLFGMSSCSQDRDPKYHDPVPGSFVLNTPAMQNQEIILVEGRNNTIEFSCSQPDYGFAASANYSMEMALSEDFNEYYSLSSVTPTSAIISVRQSEVAAGYCDLLGLDSEESYNERYPDGFPVTKIYFRAVCQLPGYEDSIIKSNIVTYNYIKPYFAVAVPGYIYLVGAPTGWTEPSEGNASFYNSWKLSEPNDAIGSKIYTGVFNIDAGDVYFRFYEELSGWGNDGELPSIGPKPKDNDNLEISLSSGSYTGSAVPGKGSWALLGWEGGEITMVVDLSNASNYTVTFTAGAVEVFIPSSIYLVGSYNGWTAPCVDNKGNLVALQNSSAAQGVYSATVEVSEGEFWFRFCTELSEDAGGWGPTIGWQEPDDGAVFEFTNNHFEGSFVNPGSGSWCFNMPSEGNFTMVVNMDNNTVDYTFEAK